MDKNKIKEITKITEEYHKELNKLIETKEKEIEGIIKKYKLDINDLKLVNEVNNLNGIKNFYRYRLLVKLIKFEDDIINLSDFDTYSKVIKNIENENYIHINKRYFKYAKQENIILETDTAFSFKTIFHDFLRKYLRESTIDKYQKEYSIDKSNDLYLYAYMLKNIDQIYIDNPEYNTLLNKFNEFAYIYHSMNNVVLVPLFYNTNRKNKELYPLDMDDLINKYHFDESIYDICNYKYDFKNQMDFFKNIFEKLSSPKELISKEEYIKYFKIITEYISR